MRITKREHACLVVEKQGSALIIDPGSTTAPFDVDDLVGIVLTHEHRDHWTPEHLERLLAAHPGTPIIGPAGVAEAADGFDIDVVSPGDARTLGPFSLRFFGGTHAEIHRSIPLIDNVGVLVDEQLYYPGDSFAEPGVPVEVLATPSGAPWLKIGEVIDFVVAVAPRQTFATHDMPISAAGLAMANGRIQWAVEQGGGTHHVVAPGDTIEL